MPVNQWAAQFSRGASRATIRGQRGSQEHDPASTDNLIQTAAPVYLFDI